LLKLLTARWSELKNTMNINSKVLNDIIQNLEKAIIIEKKEDTYTIPDPIMGNLIFELSILQHLNQNIKNGKYLHKHNKITI